jgi:hypothetical protein
MQSPRGFPLHEEVCSLHWGSQNEIIGSDQVLKGIKCRPISVEKHGTEVQTAIVNMRREQSVPFIL